MAAHHAIAQGSCQGDESEDVGKQPIDTDPIVDEEKGLVADAWLTSTNHKPACDKARRCASIALCIAVVFMTWSMFLHNRPSRIAKFDDDKQSSYNTSVLDDDKQSSYNTSVPFNWTKHTFFGQLDFPSKGTPVHNKPARAECKKLYHGKQPMVKVRDYSINLLGRVIPKRECPPKQESYAYEMPKGNKCFDMNLWMEKGPKVAGSTMAGVNRRIADRQQLHCVGCDKVQSMHANEPKAMSNHAYNNEYARADFFKEETFKWAIFRNPAQRCLSNFFHHEVRDHGKTPSEANILHYAKHFCNDRLTHYYVLHCKQSADALDFLGVTERSQETLVALAHVLQLPLADILYLPSKVAAKAEGAYTYKKKTIDTHKMPHLMAYLNSQEWSEHNRQDYMWWYIANTRLDTLISKIGTARFKAQLKEFEYHVDAVGKMCPSQRRGYFSDNGKSFPCLDDYSHHHGLYTSVTDPNWRPVPFDPAWKAQHKYPEQGFRPGRL